MFAIRVRFGRGWKKGNSTTVLKNKLCLEEVNAEQAVLNALGQSPRAMQGRREYSKHLNH